MSLKTNYLLFSDFLFAYSAIHMICWYSPRSCTAHTTSAGLYWFIFTVDLLQDLCFSFTFVISKIQKKHPRSVAKTHVFHNASDGIVHILFQFVKTNTSADQYSRCHNSDISVNLIFSLILIICFFSIRSQWDGSRFSFDYIRDNLKSHVSLDHVSWPILILLFDFT